MEHIDQTIAALSTPPGEAGMAVIRMSGARALDILSAACRRRGGGRRDAGWDHRRLYLASLVDGRGEVLDDVMCAVMRGPDSYTGEDTAEITCHGGMLIVNKILEELHRLGARAAEAGEFTRRAFVNGKMDLIQAEAVCDLIHAKSDLQRQVAHELLSGGLSAQIQQLADEALTLLGEVEVNIDFIEEDIQTLDAVAAAKSLEKQRRVLAALLKSGPLSRPFREGYNLVISGPVNAGKSSLFNRMIGQDRAIVTEIPGTTRDVLREPFILGGLVFILHDTAGLRTEATDRIESIGRGKAEQAASTADLNVFVLDSSEPLTDEETNRMKQLDPERSIVVLNKIDLPEDVSARDIAGKFPRLRVKRVSAKSGEGVDALGNEIMDVVGRETISWIAQERIVLNTRLVSLLEHAHAKLAILLEQLPADAPLEIMAVELRELLGCYEDATGKRYNDQLLDNIFSRFCIGK